MDMYKIMKTLVDTRYDGAIYVDHVLRYDQACGGKKTSFAYSTGYMKGLMAAAMDEARGNKRGRWWSIWHFALKASLSR
jgi:D-mannonate dehydratase